jgi:hypothetical protein
MNAMWQLATDDIHWVNVVGKAEMAPKVSRAAVLRDPAIASGIGQFGAVQASAPLRYLRTGPGRPLDGRSVVELS